MAVISPHLSIIILNVSGLNSPIRRHRIKFLKIQQYAAYKRLTLALKIHTAWEWRGRKRYFKQMVTKRKQS